MIIGLCCCKQRRCWVVGWQCTSGGGIAGRYCFGWAGLTFSQGHCPCKNYPACKDLYCKRLLIRYRWQTGSACWSPRFGYNNHRLNQIDRKLLLLVSYNYLYIRYSLNHSPTHRYTALRYSGYYQSNWLSHSMHSFLRIGHNMCGQVGLTHNYLNIAMNT